MGFAIRNDILEKMISDKKHIQLLAALLLKKGITDVVISPGSRNARARRRP